MAENSFFWNTDGTGDGDNAGITQAQMIEIWRGLFAGNRTNLGGVRYGYLNGLAVSGTSSPVSVASGLGVVYGFVYVNSAAVNVTVPTPSANPRIDRIVLRANWATATVRITRIAGTEAGSPSAPALTQSAGTTWDVPLARVQITTGGVITVTDDRVYVGTSLLTDLVNVSAGSPSNGDLLTYVTANSRWESQAPAATVQRAIIPIAYANYAGATTGITSASTTYDIVYGNCWINKAKYPSTATYKLRAMVQYPGASKTGYIELYNRTTGASVSGSEVSGTGGIRQMVATGDIKANLATGENEYYVRIKTSDAGFPMEVISAFVEVDW